MNEGSPANPSLNGAQILAKLLALGALGAAFTDSAFAIVGSSDATKIARFEVDGLTTATTRVYTLPDANIVVAGSASALTSGRVPFATTGGLLTDSAALTWSGTSFATTATGAASFSTAGGYTSSVATGTAPFTATSTTACPNLNASLLLGNTWAAPGAIGGTTPGSAAHTTISASGQITSTVSTGTAPLVIASTTVVANLNASLLLGSTWAAPGTIGSGTPSTGAFTTISASGVITSTIATGTAPFTVASTTVVANLNATFLSGKTHADPGPIGSGTASTGAFTTLTANGATTLTAGTASSSTITGTLVVTGGVGISGAAWIGGTLNVAGNGNFNSGAIVVNGGGGENIVIVGNTTNGFATVTLRTGSTHYSWFFTAQNTVSDAFEIGPSTATGGTTYTTAHLLVYQNGSIVLGPRSALATNATDGFAYMPSCAGTPTGAPTAITGKVAWCYDSSNHIIYIHDGAWKKTAALT
jgi:hypothetical protein